jgi:serine/threonine protein kinase
MDKPLDPRDTLPVQPPGAGSIEPAPSSFPSGAAVSPRLAAGVLLAERFRIVRLLGRGGMGEVYQAEDTRLGRPVALKVLPPSLGSDPQYAQRFLREARAASALSHPAVCVIHDFGTAEDGCPYIAMELLEGESLDARIERSGLSAAEIAAIGAQIADALDAAHAKGIVHRDIKPANVSVGSAGRVKVLDFGLAKHIAGAEDSARLDTSALGTTQAGMLLGTPSYMSPEQALARPVDQRSDIFSLGALLYECITGRVPFGGTSVGEVIEHLLNAQPEAMARFNYDLPAELERIVRKCLEKSPERRYQSARELSLDLRTLERDLEAGHGSAAPPVMHGAQTAVVPLPLDASGTAPVAATAAPIDDVKRADVFLTYAQVDDQPVISGRQGWISQLQRNLKVRLEQLSGEDVRIWPQSNPLGSSEPEPRIIEQLPEVKTLVSVLSPPFVHSEGCRGQVAAFWRAAEARGTLDVESRSRVFKVVKTPVEARELPADVAPLLGRLRSFDFFELDSETGRLREFDEALGELWRQRYHERVYDVAYELAQVLKNLRTRASDRRAAVSGGKVIYLAATTADLSAQRDQLQRELVELGHTVLPDHPLPVIASALEAVVRTALAECDAAIHLVGDRYGLVPEDTDLSVVALQNRIAAEASALRALPRFVWMPRGLAPRDERQAAFIRDLMRDPETHRGAEVVADTLENLKVLLRERWEKKTAAADIAGVEGAAAPPRVYLICDPRDEAAIESLEDFFYTQGIEVCLPAFEAGETEAQDVHLRNLRDCDGALIYYGAGGHHWVDFNIRDLEKAAGYRDARPIAPRAVYVAPPASHRKDRFKSVSAEVLRQPGDALDPSVLAAFAGALKAGRHSA